MGYSLVCFLYKRIARQRCAYTTLLHSIISCRLLLLLLLIIQVNQKNVFTIIMFCCLRFLNVNGPLQLGGISKRDLMYPSLNNKDYTGCIRNVINDGVLYDLSNPSESEGSKEGCPVMDKHCEQASCSDGACVSSWTGYKCECPMGKHGDTCRKRKFCISF